MTATVIDGKKIASEIQEQVSLEIETRGLKPKLTVVLVGEDPASQVYVNKKKKVCEEVGIRSVVRTFPAVVGQGEVEDFIYGAKDTDGILVQLPLPAHLDKDRILNAIPPEKDVDCFTAVNMGRLAQGNAVLKPCTPSGILEILRYHKIPTEGKRVVIINRSRVIGQPLALMLQQEPYNATVTVCHEYTTNLIRHVRDSNIIITAVGKYPNFKLRTHWLSPSSAVIDVAMNRVGGKLFGDVVDFAAAKEKVKYISPVPGCVGLTTVACLMKNTLMCAKLQC